MPTTSSSSIETKRKRSTSAGKSAALSASSQRTTVLRQSSLAQQHLHGDDQEFLRHSATTTRDPIYGLYPPEADADGFYRYRRGRVQKSPKSLNTFILLPLVFAGFGCGHFMNLLIMMVNYVFDSHSGAVFHLDFTNSLDVAAILSISATFTVIAYYAGCRHVEKAFYDSDASRNKSEEWKCKPYMWLSDDLRFQEIVSGCFNAVVGSVAGVSIFIYQQLPTTAPGTVKMYYDLQDPLYANWGTQILGGWPTYVATTIIYFLVADFWAFWAHKTLHWPFLYRYIHKFHHQFKSVSPFGAYALHPLEFIFIMSGFQGFVFLMPLHFSSLAINLVYIGYHAIIDHAGVDFDGWFSFSPSTMFHDDHHTHFHCNFGQSLVVWDWMFGSLRNTGKKYGVENFHD